MIGIRQHREPAQLRKHVLEQLNSFSRQVQREERAAGEIAARPSQGLDQAELDRVAADGEQDGNVGGGPQRANGRAARHRQVPVAPRQLGYHRAQRIGISGCVAKLEDDVPALDVAALAQSLAKSVHERVGLGFGGSPKDAMQFCGLLCARRERPRCRCAAKHAEKLAPPHLFDLSIVATRL